MPHPTFLCCRAAVRSMLGSGTAGRIVNVTARPGARSARGSGMVRLCREQGGGRGDHGRAGRGIEGQRHPRQRGGALDARHAGQPGGHAEGRFRQMGRASKRPPRRSPISPRRRTWRSAARWCRFTAAPDTSRRSRYDESVQVDHALQLALRGRPVGRALDHAVHAAAARFRCAAPAACRSTTASACVMRWLCRTYSIQVGV